MSSIERLRDRKPGKYNLVSNRVVTKRKWLFLTETVVEPKIIGTVSIHKMQHRDKAVTMSIFDGVDFLGTLVINSDRNINPYIGGVGRHTSTHDKKLKAVSDLLWKADEIVLRK